MNDKLHPALAEHAMEAELQLERERHRKTWRQLEQVRGLLRMATDRWASWASEIIHTTPEYESELAEIARVRATLSQQPEPAPVNQCDGCQAGVPVDDNGNHRMGKPGGYADLMRCEKARYVSEPAPAQDEREARALFEQMGLIADDEQCIQMLATALATRPAQTEQPEQSGLVSLPLEPTEAMLDAYWQQTGEPTLMRGRVHDRAKRHYSAMVQAALATQGSSKP